LTGDNVVQVAYLHSETVSHSWVESMRKLRDHDLKRAIADGADLAQAIEHGYRIAPNPLNLRCGAGLVAQIRNYGARLFLDATDHEWLMWIDTDMGFAPDAVHRLLAVADPVTRPVVGGLCFALMEAEYDGMGGWRRTVVPTMYKMGTTNETGEPSFCYYGDYPRDEVCEVAGTGGAFILIHRTALQKVRADVGDRWYDMMYDRAGDIVGEDIAFCGRLLKVGVVPAVHTGVKTTHHKHMWIGEEDYEVQQATTVTVDPDLPPAVDLGASLASLATNAHVHDGMLKLVEDLDRYEQIIADTKPEVVVETGTRTGASALWFAAHGLDAITIDINPAPAELLTQARDVDGTVAAFTGSSTDPNIVAQVAALVAGRRCMVSLDSDHSGPHVTAEIDAYGPLVTPGCYLVVEDGIFGHAPLALRAAHGLGGMVGSPLDAIADRLNNNPAWSRDIAIERLSPVSHHPAGWWIRNGG
jgi:cephalosporin hydroxylase